MLSFIMLTLVKFQHERPQMALQAYFIFPCGWILEQSLLKVDQKVLMKFTDLLFMNNVSNVIPQIKIFLEKLYKDYNQEYTLRGIASRNW